MVEYLLSNFYLIEIDDHQSIITFTVVPRTCTVWSYIPSWAVSDHVTINKLTWFCMQWVKNAGLGMHARLFVPQNIAGYLASTLLVARTGTQRSTTMNESPSVHWLAARKDRPGMEGNESRRSCRWKTPCTSQTGYISLRSRSRDRPFPHTLTCGFFIHAAIHHRTINQVLKFS